MGQITVLSELIANKIAAGEVVERPASIVKELVENAIDAGSHTIRVDVRHGGRSLIRVCDDGCGMDAADARACLLRHATSKIRTAEDIPGIATMGFRGEALPSIASVSRLKITTRCAGEETGTVVTVEGGTLTAVEPCVAEPGTTVEVADLFFNTPARKKFLKTEAAEHNAITEVFSSLALARPDVSFELLRNSARVARYPACARPIERIARVLGDELAGHLIPFFHNLDGFQTTGFIARPECSRINRTGQKLYINGRVVVSPTVQNALSRAYEAFLPQRRFPVAVLFLSVSPENVDVNVHPAKREVRLRNERAFVDRLVGAVRDRLRAEGVPVTQSSPPAAAPFSVPPALSFRGNGPVLPREKGEIPWHYTPPRQENPTLHACDPGPQQVTLPVSDPDRLPFGILRLTGQVLGTYLLAETESGLMLFDQHAAHERIVFEALLDKATASPRQTLIAGLKLQLGLEENAAMEEHLTEFAKTGFDISSLGGGTWVINAVPIDLAVSDPVALVRDALHELREQPSTRVFASRREELAAILACKSRSVKAGRVLSAQEGAHLLQRLVACHNPHTCPHGRPTRVVLSRQEIAKRFKRSH